MQTFYIKKNLQQKSKEIKGSSEGWFTNILPTKYYKRKCRHCGYEMNFYVHKRKLCRVCNNYIYPDDKEEFREILKEKRKEIR